jgi:hypothetical protein
MREDPTHQDRWIHQVTSRSIIERTSRLTLTRVGHLNQSGINSAAYVLVAHLVIYHSDQIACMVIALCSESAESSHEASQGFETLTAIYCMHTHVIPNRGRLISGFLSAP